MDFTAFDEKINQKELQKQLNESKEYEDVPDGTYIVGIEKMEIKPTKAGDKLMFALQCRIKEGPQKKRLIFFNRVIAGNRNTEKWNDGRAISGVCTWLNKLISEDDDPITFVNYTDFAEQVLDLFQEVQSSVELEVSYVADDFNPISIKEVFDI